MDGASGLFEWLLDGVPGAATSAEVVERMARDLSDGGIPVDRIAVFVTTLHPTVLGRSFRWTRDKPMEVRELTLAMQQSDSVMKSPVSETTRERREFRRRLVGGGIGPNDYAMLHGLAGEGFTDFVCFPIIFTSGEVHAISFATRSDGGFGDAQLSELRRILRPLARVTEIFALRRTATNLLSTYVGRNSGERILAGRIFKGDIETIRAVLWFSDLRGFTAMSARQSARATIDVLNELFDCQVVPIEQRAGEVLKFMGDGLLAIFPFTSDEEAAPLCAAALAAADQAFAALAVRNAEKEPAIQFGLALHVGEIAYGNIGGASRLDFTAIGPAVNLAARLEGLTSKVGRALVVSSDFARLADRAFVDLGEFELKGVHEPQHVFAPV